MYYPLLATNMASDILGITIINQLYFHTDLSIVLTTFPHRPIREQHLFRQELMTNHRVRVIQMSA